MITPRVDGSTGPAFPPHWQRYRDGFAVLQHLCALAGASDRVPVTWPRVVADLGLTEEEGSRLLEYLIRLGLLRQLGRDHCVTLMPGALEYLGAGRGRRTSVRPPRPG